MTRRGFTLLEVILATTLFALLMSSYYAIFFNVSQLEEYARSQRAFSAVGPAILDLVASLPETGERDYRDDSTIFTFRGRCIGIVTGDGSELFVKTTVDERDALVLSDPETFSEWWSSGRFGWVRVRLDRVEPDEAFELVVDAWRLTAPKRMVRAYDEGAGASG